MPFESVSNDLLYQKLRLAIDEANVDEINELFQDYPEINWNSITPNGLSALWWAITPPRGKSINPAIVSLLLSLTRNNIPVIDPTQLYANLRPNYYLKYFVPNTKPLRTEIKIAQEIYANIMENEITQQERVNQLIGDTHSASNPFVVRASDLNLKRLYQRYKTRLVVEDELKDIDAFMKSPTFQKFFPLQFQQDQIFTTFQQIKIDMTPRSDMTSEAGPSNLKEALALAWLAAKETQTDLVSDPNPLERQKAIFEAFFVIQQDAACWPGRWGWIGTVLTGMHQDVYYGSDIKFTGDIARDRFTVLLGNMIADTYENNRAIYWSILRARLEISDEKTATMANTWLQEKLPILKERMLQANIDPKEIPNFLDNITIDFIPLSRHEPSRQLGVLQKLFHQHNGANLFKYDNDDVYKLLENLKTIFLNNYLNPPNDIDKLNLEPSKVNQFKQWMLDNLLARSHEDAAIKIADLWQVVKIQIKITNLKNDVLSNWYKTLDLTKQIAIARDSLSINTLSEKDLVALALKYFCIAGLSFKGMDLSGMDFRGWNLNNLDFRDANLTGVDLRLINGGNVLWKGCNLADAEFNSIIFIEALIDSISCTEELLLKAKTEDGVPVLDMLFSNTMHFPLFKKIINSPYCKENVLMMRNYWDKTILDHTIISYPTEFSDQVAKIILSSPFCTEKVLGSQDECNSETALHRAVHNTRKNILDLILSSPYCTKEVLMVPDKRGATALHVAMFSGQPEIAKMIFASPNCTEDVLAIQNKEGKTILHEALYTQQRNSWQAFLPFVHTIINSPLCTERLLMARDRSGRTVLDIAFACGFFETVKTILASPHCKEKVLAAQNSSNKISPAAKIHNQLLKESFLKDLKKFLKDKDITKAEILERFKEIREKNGKYAYIHVQLNPRWDQFQIFFKRAANGEKNFWHTKTYQEAVKMLKNAYLAKSGNINYAEMNTEEKALINYYRGNSPLHILPTATRRALK